MSRTLLLGFAVAAIPTLSTVAAVASPATPEEAARLATLFERYVGHPAPGEPASVTVAPRGDSYVATLDVARALAGLAGLGFTVDPLMSSTTLTPLPDGTWKVTSTDSPPITLHFGEQTVSLASATSSFEGIYDPKIYGFSRSRQEQSSYSYRQTTPTVVQDRHIDKVVFDLTGTPADGATVDVTGRYGLAGIAATIAAVTQDATPDPTAAGRDPAVPPASRPVVSYSYAVPAGTMDVGLDRLRTESALDLWAFLVAHPNRDSLAGAQDELKTMLRAGMPYFTALREAGSFDAPSLTTPVGVVTARSAGGSLDVSDLATGGKAKLAVSLAGLAVPPGPLPPWSAGLVPTGLDLHLGVEGFHAAAALRELVDDVDLKKDVVITAEQKQATGRTFWPGDGTLTLAPSRLTTAVLDLHMEGRATMGARPAGTVTITGTGLDKEIAALQARAATDPGAGQVLGPLVLAKNLAKPNPDGSLVWVVAFGAGPVTVNGATMQ